MTAIGTTDLTIAPASLSSAALAPFGEVIEHRGTDRRHMIETAFETDDAALERVLWVSRVAAPGQLPLRVTTMERHPHSAQWFSPLECSAYLVAVCPPLPDGGPDIRQLRAFIARPGQGVVYRRNVWHHPMVALGAPALFAVSMATGCADDDVFVRIHDHICIGEATA